MGSGERRATRRLAPAALVAIGAGGALAVGLVAWAGAGAIAAAVLRAGWVLPPLLALNATQLLASALGWRRAAGGGGPGLATWVRIRWIRGSVNALLPVAQIGGLLVGIRLLGHRGLPLATAAAGTMLDLTVEALAQLLFTLLGVAALAAAGADAAWLAWLGGGLLLMGLGLAGFVLAQRAGMLFLVERLAARLGGIVPLLPAESMRGMHTELLRLQARRGDMARAGAWHLLGWLLGVGETWLALAALGRPTGVAAALAIESLGTAARSAGFAVPGALGVQEGGLLLVGGLLGVAPETAVALSVVKRARELLTGLPGLLAWQWAEGRRLVRRRRSER